MLLLISRRNSWIKTCDNKTNLNKSFAIKLTKPIVYFHKFQQIILLLYR